MFSQISNLFIGSPRFYLGLSIMLIALGGVFQAAADTEANKAVVLLNRHPIQIIIAVI